MNEQDKLPRIMKKFPELKAADQAIQELNNTVPITAVCPYCHHLLTINRIPSGSIWVVCPKNCTNIHYTIRSSSVVD